MKTTRKIIDVEDAYANAHQEACDLLEKIADVLQDMPAPGDDEHPVNWGHVGDVAHINFVLSQLLARR